MPRIARVVVPGAPHHVTQRGIRRFDIFRDTADRLDYLKLIARSCQKFRLRILSYCLMTNHVHFIAVPEAADSLYRVFHRAHGIYAQNFNMKYGLTGHLWQDRPYSCVLDESHFWNAIRYVEQNPVRAGMVESAVDYPWSSAASRCGLGGDPLAEGQTLELPTDISIANGAAWLDGMLDSDSVQRLRTCTLTGKPFGDDAFVNQVAQRTHRNFARKKSGPKPKSR